MRWGLVLGVLAGLLWAGDARAGTYDVYGCRLPDGTPIAADGWTSSAPWAGTYATNGCAYLAGLSAGLDQSASAPSQSYAAWAFDAPADTTISGYELYRSGRTANALSFPAARNLWFFHDAQVFDTGDGRYLQNACAWFAGCHQLGDPSQAMAPVNREAGAGLQIRRLIYAAYCNSGTDCSPTGPAYVTIWASRITLADPYAPSYAETPHGALIAGSSAVLGSQSVSFRAEDHGSGIASAGFLVDGRVISEEPADPISKSCVRPYVLRVPCPLAVERTMTLDTTQVSNGVHQVQVALFDAAGNRTLSEPATVDVRNPGAPNGVAASRFARIDAWFETTHSKRRTRAVVAYGRTKALTGRLVDEHGTPIGGATLDVTSAADRPAARARIVGQTLTAPDGTFRFRSRVGSSRHFTIGYRAFTLDASPTATATLALQVRAGVTLSVTPRRVSARGTIRFSGRLRGGPGREGTQVVIYALGGARERIPVATVRANAAGRFHYRYRFRNSAPGVTYRFHATMHAQRSYPYATGTSRTATVRIR